MSEPRIVTLDTADPDIARAALAGALAAYGPPVTVRRPGRPDLTVGVTAGELTSNIGRLWATLYRACAILPGPDTVLSAPGGRD